MLLSLTSDFNPITKEYYPAGVADKVREGLMLDLELSVMGNFALKGIGQSLNYRFEYGSWKFRGEWSSGWHFHIGNKASGLGYHHLPQQIGNWFKNLWNIIIKK
jgi:hypothetical protein